MGEKSINLKSGNHTTMVQPGGAIRGEVITDLSQLAPSVAPLLDEMSDVLERVRELLDQQTETDVRESLKNMGEVTTGMRKIVTNDLGNLQKVMKSVEGTTSNMQEMSAKEKAKVDTILSHLQETSARLTALTESLTTTSASFNRVAERLDRGDGTLGKLLVDDSLYKRLERTVGSADSLIQDVKTNPKKYVHIEIF
jgi:phospholipid/cholesterol/gamma-HCH transport system substrate-binding protein